MISNRVLKQDQYGDAVWYRVACDCGSQDCDLSLELEYDKELGMIFLSMYKDLHWSSHWVSRDEPGWWWRSKWLRLKTAFRILRWSGLSSRLIPEPFTALIASLLVLRGKLVENNPLSVNIPATNSPFLC